MYQLEITEKQRSIIQVASEEYYRIRKGDFDQLLNDLVGMANTSDKLAVVFFKNELGIAEPINDERMIAKTKSLFGQAYRTAIGQADFTENTASMTIAEAIYLGIKHQFCKKDEEVQKDSYVPDVCVPVLEEPMPVIELKSNWRHEDYKYCLRLTPNQINVVKNILEEYFRIRLGQMFDLSTELAGLTYTYDRSETDHDMKFNAYIERRNHSKELFEQAYRTAMCGAYCGKKTDEMCIAEDIWQVIRHQQWKDDHDANKSIYVVSSRPPTQVSHEPLPKITCGSD